MDTAAVTGSATANYLLAAGEKKTFAARPQVHR
jgi:hypothetical protein